MEKICSKCKYVKTIFTLENINSGLGVVYQCKNLQYKRSIVEAAIKKDPQNANKLTDKEIKKYPFSTNTITTECKFYKPAE